MSSALGFTCMPLVYIIIIVSIAWPGIKKEACKDLIEDELVGHVWKGLLKWV